jgi:hypothetical protein
LYSNRLLDCGSRRQPEVLSDGMQMRNQRFKLRRALRVGLTSTEAIAVFSSAVEAFGAAFALYALVVCISISAGGDRNEPHLQVIYPYARRVSYLICTTYVLKETFTEYETFYHGLGSVSLIMCRSSSSHNALWKSIHRLK